MMPSTLFPIESTNYAPSAILTFICFERNSTFRDHAIDCSNEIFLISVYEFIADLLSGMFAMFIYLRCMRQIHLILIDLIIYLHGYYLSYLNRILIQLDGLLDDLMRTHTILGDLIDHFVDKNDLDMLLKLKKLHKKSKRIFDRIKLIKDGVVGASNDFHRLDIFEDDLNKLRVELDTIVGCLNEIQIVVNGCD